MKLNARELRKTTPQETNLTQVNRNPIYFVLDNILDTYNIGSLFRLGDALAVEKIYICGNCEYPPSSRIHKAAVGTEAWVPWTKRDSALEVIKELKKQGVYIVAVEQDPRSVPYNKFPCLPAGRPVALVVGHETNGVSAEVLDLADIIVELPMFGVNKSFNVWGSAAIVAYQLATSFA